MKDFYIFVHFSWMNTENVKINQCSLFISWRDFEIIDYGNSILRFAIFWFVSFSSSDLLKKKNLKRKKNSQIINFFFQMHIMWKISKNSQLATLISTHILLRHLVKRIFLFAVSLARKQLTFLYHFVWADSQICSSL